MRTIVRTITSDVNAPMLLLRWRPVRYRRIACKETQELFGNLMQRQEEWVRGAKAVDPTTFAMDTDIEAR